jgi:hypothetical protein
MATHYRRIVEYLRGVFGAHGLGTVRGCSLVTIPSLREYPAAARSGNAQMLRDGRFPRSRRQPVRRSPILAR